MKMLVIKLWKFVWTQTRVFWEFHCWNLFGLKSQLILVLMKLLKLVLIYTEKKTKCSFEWNSMFNSKFKLHWNRFRWFFYQFHLYSRGIYVRYSVFVRCMHALIITFFWLICAQSAGKKIQSLGWNWLFLLDIPRGKKLIKFIEKTLFFQFEFQEHWQVYVIGTYFAIYFYLNFIFPAGKQKEKMETH